MSTLSRKLVEYVELSKIIKEKEEELSRLKEYLYEQGSNTYYLPHHETKVTVSEPVKTTQVDGKKLGQHLVETGRLKDLLKVITINKKDLEILIDGNELESKFTVEGSTRNPTIRISGISSKDLKTLEESGKYSTTKTLITL